jgi:RNA recognition motif-containing protein
MNIFVGNLSYATEDDGLRALFEQYGVVASAKVIRSRESGRSRGFAFLEMPNDDEARAAIAQVDGKELDGRPLKVSEAHQKPDRR